jgi:hypothetical protein
VARSERRRAARHTVSFAALALCGLASSAPAEENRYNVHFEIGPLLTFLQPSLRNDLQVRTPGLHVALAFEYSMLERLGVEVQYAPDTTYRLVGGGGALEQRLAVGLRLRPWYRRGYILPRDPDVDLDVDHVLSDVWIAAHIGAAVGVVDSLAIDGAIGARLPLHWPFQLGAFIRYQHLFSVDSSVHGSFGQLAVGIEASLGFLPVPRARDADRDGVPDGEDRCPNTPAGTRVNAVGCAVGKNSTAPACTDSDLDGVCEGSDQCPDTPLNTPVDKTGCPLEAAPLDAPIPPPNH